MNLTKAGGDGSCTGTTVEQCSVHSNSTLGVIIPSVQSARFNTKGKVSIKYGRVEVVAKFPVGDWLWPAICELFSFPSLNLEAFSAPFIGYFFFPPRLPYTGIKFLTSNFFRLYQG